MFDAQQTVCHHLSIGEDLQITKETTAGVKKKLRPTALSASNLLTRDVYHPRLPKEWLPGFFIISMACFRGAIWDLPRETATGPWARDAWVPSSFTYRNCRGRFLFGSESRRAVLGGGNRNQPEFDPTSLTFFGGSADTPFSADLVPMYPKNIARATMLVS